MSEWRLWVTALAMVYGYLLFLICLQALYRAWRSKIRRKPHRKPHDP
jgi:hypothetical protein